MHDSQYERLNSESVTLSYIRHIFIYLFLYFHISKFQFMERFRVIFRLIITDF